jgi:hypothetical protein
MYRHYDGYPSGHGKELADFLSPITIINGISRGQDVLGKFANGMGCLSAQLVKHFKDNVGGIYLQPPGDGSAHEEYTYFIVGAPPAELGGDSAPPTVRVYSGDELAFEGPVAEFAMWCVKEEEDD